jgi:hypothetical protein
MLEDHFDVEGPCWDPLGIFGIVMFSNRVSEVFEPQKNVFGCDVRILKDCDEYFVTDPWCWDGVVANNFTYEELRLAGSLLEEVEVWCWVDVCELDWIFELIGDSEAPVRELAEIVYGDFVKVSFKNFGPNVPKNTIG